VELNWTTFVLEILNFLVLVWLLKRFFYLPVMGMIERRRQAIAAELGQAEDKQRQAQELQQQYENRLADWEQEREAARQQLCSEMEEERRRLQAGLQQELEAERQKAEVLAERTLAEQQRQIEVLALEQGARFVARLLESVASPEVPDRLFAHLLEQLEHLPPAQREALRLSAESSRAALVEAEVLSAYPLSDTQRQQLREQIGARVPHKLRCEFHEDRKLIAGLRITVGPWVMHANLHDELKTFAAIAHEH
jgi:F-type H+-transporting ATPase subunit b